jgi:hypothetical protein
MHKKIMVKIYQNAFLGRRRRRRRRQGQAPTVAKVDCSGERLRVCRKNLRMLKTFSSYTLIKTRNIL